MLKIADKVREIVNNNPLLKMGMYNNILNLSKTAKFIQPLIATKTKKEVKENAILMALSRLQKEKISTKPKKEEFVFSNLIVYSNLCSVVFYQSAEVLEKISRVYAEVQKTNSFINLIKGVSEIVIIMEDKYLSLIKNIIKEEPKNIEKNISALGIQFSQKYYYIPGIIYEVIQQISLQGINIFEISNTFTELVVYVNEKDIRQTFDTIYNSFSPKNVKYENKKYSTNA